MPIYEYECSACGKALEALQKITDAPLRICPDCGQETLRKLVSASSFQLKGTGWYVTDFRDKKPATSSDANKTDPADTTKTTTKDDSAAAKSGDQSSSSSSNSTKTGGEAA